MPSHYSFRSFSILIVCRLIVIMDIPLSMEDDVDMDIIKVFGSNVKQHRIAIGLSQEAFAEKCGMHRTYISAIECYRRSISLENIQRIADALEIDTYKLFLEDEDHGTQR